MPKQIQGLRKRTRSIQYVKNREEEKQSPIRNGDLVQLFHENGTSIQVRVETTQEEGIIIGTVIKMGAEAPGVSIDDLIVSHEDFVFVVTKGT
jgi:hypothetical protein